jgi:hypothetical protein
MLVVQCKRNLIGSLNVFKLVIVQKIDHFKGFETFSNSLESHSIVELTSKHRTCVL